MTPELPTQSPLYHAANADRYDRQEAIRAYEQKFSCCLIVMIDAIFPPSVTQFEDLIYDANPDGDIHLLLNSPGGEGETAIRLVRAAQARCRDLTVIIPDQAKSAATLLALGAHHILMSPMSDFGPIDPQLPGDGELLVAAKDIIAAVDNAAQKVQEAPEIYPLYVSLLSDVSSIMLQQARAALDSAADLLQEALSSNPARSAAEVTHLSNTLTEPLINRPRTHSALFSVRNAIDAGLPAQEVALQSEQWQMVWSLWTKYFTLLYSGQIRGIYEGRRVSLPLPPYP